MTVREVGEALHVSRTTVDDLLRAGRLPRIKIGRAVRVPSSAVAALVRSCEVPTNDNDPAGRPGRCETSTAGQGRHATG